jgi:hypothetical protein
MPRPRSAIFPTALPRAGASNGSLPPNTLVPETPPAKHNKRKGTSARFTPKADPLRETEWEVRRHTPDEFAKRLLRAAVADPEPSWDANPSKDDLTSFAKVRSQKRKDRDDRGPVGSAFEPMRKSKAGKMAEDAALLPGAGKTEQVELAKVRKKKVARDDILQDLFGSV